MNYVVFQLIDKIFGAASVIYSLLSFSVIAIETDKFTQFLISLTAVICVIIALYLTPRARIAEYDRSAKYLDEQYLKICNYILQESVSKTTKEEILSSVSKMIGDAIAQAEKRIESDEQ